MSVFQFLASNQPLKEVKNLYEGYLNEIEIKNSIYHYCEYEKAYSDKTCFSELHWSYTEARAKQLVEYLKDQLKHLDEIEIWSIWLDDYESANIISVPIAELSIQDLEFLDRFDKPTCILVKK